MPIGAKLFFTGAVVAVCICPVGAYATERHNDTLEGIAKGVLTGSFLTMLAGVVVGIWSL